MKKILVLIGILLFVFPVCAYYNETFVGNNTITTSTGDFFSWRTGSGLGTAGNVSNYSLTRVISLNGTSIDTGSGNISEINLQLFTISHLQKLGYIQTFTRVEGFDLLFQCAIVQTMCLIMLLIIQIYQMIHNRFGRLMKK